MSIAELEGELAARGIVLEVREGRLGARGNVGALTAPLRAAIDEHKPALLERCGSQLEGGRWDDVAWIKERMKGIYGLIKEALEAGYLGPAQQMGADVVAAVEQVAREGGDVARACRLLSRDGAGNDVAAAALVAAYEQLCVALQRQGVDAFRRRAAVALCLARALEPAGGPVVTSEGTLRRLGRARAGRAALHRTTGTAGASG